MNSTKKQGGVSAVLSTDGLGGNDWYTEDGQPIKCWKCGCTEQREVVISMVDVFQGMGPVCEYEVFCAVCAEKACDRRAAAFDVRAKIIDPPTGRSSRCTSPR